MKNEQSSPAPERPTREQIAAKAYEIYLESGKMAGRSEQNWFRAEQLLLQECARAALDRMLPDESPERHPKDFQQQSTFARDERGSASREEIRQETSPMRPAPRQSLRKPERSRQTRSSP